MSAAAKRHQKQRTAVVAKLAEYAETYGCTGGFFAYCPRALPNDADKWCMGCAVRWASGALETARLTRPST